MKVLSSPAVHTKKPSKGDAIVLSVRVKLVQSIWLPPNKSAVIDVHLEHPLADVSGPVVVESDGSFERVWTDRGGCTTCPN